jgi:hypothetical protein
VTGTSQSETKQEKKRIEWIRHSNIRAAGNYARYVQRFNQYARSKLELKHKNDSTEMISYHNKEFKWMMGHQLGLTQAVLVNHVMGINRNEQLANLFQTPMASCSDPKAPTYNNAPKIKEDEICTAWWQCLVSCDRANVNPIINGPYIMAFKRVMKDLKKEYSRDQDWEKEFIVPYRSVKARLKQFTKEEIKHCETSYPKCLDFIRNLMHFRYPKMRSKETNNV